MPRYARNGDVSLAYEVFGEGERDILVTLGWVASFQSAWEDPEYARWLRTLPIEPAKKSADEPMEPANSPAKKDVKIEPKKLNSPPNPFERKDDDLLKGLKK